MIDYIHVDRGRKRTVVFFNGLFTCYKVWHLQRTSLWDFNLLLSNNREYGTSSPNSSTPATYLYDCAKDNSELLSALSIRHPDIVAFSMGALIATAFHHLSKRDVRTITFVSPVVSNPMQTFQFAFLIPPLIKALEGMKEDQHWLGALRRFFRIVASDPALLTMYMRLRELRATMNYSEFSTYIKDSIDINPTAGVLSLKAMIEKGDEIQKLMGEIEVPVLVARGGKDMFVSEKSVEIIRKYIPHAEIMLFPDATHYPHMEQPKSFNRALYEFLVRH